MVEAYRGSEVYTEILAGDADKERTIILLSMPWKSQCEVPSITYDFLETYPYVSLHLGIAVIRIQFSSCVAFVMCCSFLAAQESPKANGARDKGDGQAAVPVVVFRGHPTEVTSLAFSSDGKKVFSADERHVSLWDSATGQETKRINVPERSTVGINPDLNRLAIAHPFYFGRLAESLNGKISILDTVSGNEIYTFDPHGKVNLDVPFTPIIAAISFSSDGKSLATAGGAVKVRGDLHRGFVKTWEAATGQQLRQFDELTSCADVVKLSPDGKFLAAGTTGISGELPESAEVHVWDTGTGKRLHTLKTMRQVEQGGNPGSVMQLSFHPQGTLLAAALSDGSVRLWELESGRQVFELRGDQSRSGDQEIDKFTGLISRGGVAVRAVAFSPDGSSLASAGYDRIVRVWNSRTGKQTATYRFESPRINAVAFSYDGKRLAAAGSDTKKTGIVAIWNFSD